MSSAPGAIRRAVLLVLLSLGGICAFAAPAGPPDQETTRIVSLVPSLTESLFAIGAAEQVVGVSDFCKYPPQARSKLRVGGLLNPSLERILILKPSVVLLYQSQGEAAAKLEQLGIETRLIAVDRLEDVFRNLKSLGALTGRQLQAEAAENRLRNELRSILQQTASLRHPETLIVVSRDSAELRNVYVSTPHHYLGELLEIAGGDNVVQPSAVSAFTKEQIVQSDPEVILDLSLAELAGDISGGTPSKIPWKQLSSVRAVKQGRVHYLSDPHALVPGLSAGKTARAMFHLLHPEKNE